MERGGGKGSAKEMGRSLFEFSGARSLSIGIARRPLETIHKHKISDNHVLAVQFVAGIYLKYAAKLANAKILLITRSLACVAVGRSQLILSEIYRT